MRHLSRRSFLADVGAGMLAASVGTGLVRDLGLRSLAADEPDTRLRFGALEPLAGLMQETPPERLLPALVARLRAGTELRTLVAAGALANARAFGGRNYGGYHHFMALAPALDMSREFPEPLRPLPVLKVLYRNTAQMQGARDALAPIESPAAVAPDAELALRAAIRARDLGLAERTLAGLVSEPRRALDAIRLVADDDADVHRVVLAWRAWSTLDLTGHEHALTLLRQSVRFCLMFEPKPFAPEIRTLLPDLLTRHGLFDQPRRVAAATDAELSRLCLVVAGPDRTRAADAAATALAQGMHSEDVGEAISLAATLRVLRDPGRGAANGAKRAGTVHGNSIGVHASDAANAWRNIARASTHRDAAAGLIVAAYYTAGEDGYAHQCGTDYEGVRTLASAWPHAEHQALIETRDPAALVDQLDAAIRAQDQARACAVVHRYGMGGHSARPVLDVLLRYATSEDGALHAEKYYRTASEEFARTRPAFRWRHLAALARVTASEYGNPAPGYDEARRLLEG